MPTITKSDAKVYENRALSDPEWFFRDILGADPYDKQIEIVESVRDNEQTTVSGSNGVGKDWTIGRIIPWWQSTHYPAMTLLVGPTHRQVSDIVWRETREAYVSSLAPLGGRMLPRDTRWECDDKHFALGFSTDQPLNMLGFHGENLLVIVTEAHNLGDDYFTSIKRWQPARLLLSGNPIVEAGEFFASHHEKSHLYNSIKISAWDTPTVKYGKHVPGLITPADIQKYKDDWGEDSPLYDATVNGNFVSSENGLLPLRLVLAAKERKRRPPFGYYQAGLDCAGPGKAETVLAIRNGNTLIHMKSWAISDPRGAIIAELAPYRERLEYVNVDATGLGWGYYLHLAGEFGEDKVNPVNVGEVPEGYEGDRYAGDLYANKKAQYYWGLRKIFEITDPLSAVSGLVYPKAASQLTSIRYGVDPRGHIAMETKAAMESRGIPSPDWAEALMLCYAPGRRRRAQVSISSG